MNNKIKLLKERKEKLSKIVNELYRADRKLYKHIQENRDEIIEKDKIDQTIEVWRAIVDKTKIVENEISINASEIRKAEIEAILNENIDIYEIFRYFQVNDYSKEQLKTVIIKAGEQKIDTRYYNSDDMDTNMKKNTFNNKYLCTRKNRYMHHDKIYYVQELATMTSNYLYNMEIIAETEAGTPHWIFKTDEDIKMLINQNIEYLKEIKVYVAVLQKIYDVKF